MKTIALVVAWVSAGIYASAFSITVLAALLEDAELVKQAYTVTVAALFLGGAGAYVAREK